MVSGKRVCSVMWKAVQASFGFALLHTVVGYLSFSGPLVTCHDCNRFAARIFNGFDLIDVFHSVTGLLHCMYAFFSFFFFYQLLLQCNIIFQLVFYYKWIKNECPIFLPLLWPVPFKDWQFLRDKCASLSCYYYYLLVNKWNASATSFPWRLCLRKKMIK